jgi:hypothetical protein
MLPRAKAGFPAAMGRFDKTRLGSASALFAKTVSDAHSLTRATSRLLLPASPGTPSARRTALRRTRQCASKFQRNFPTKDGVTRSVNRTHPAFAELLDDLVVAERPPDHGRPFLDV